MATYEIFHNHCKYKTMTKSILVGSESEKTSSPAEKRTITNERCPHGVKCDEAVFLFLDLLGKILKIHNDINWQAKRKLK